jgi:coenzyme F420-0:L-glutamate ligase/coenzyme F420-1:gamma-L-glutamate ligase
MKKIEILGLENIPQINQADNLAQIIIRACEGQIGGLQEKDVIVLTSKIVSKAQGRTKRLDEVVPGKKARYISRKTGKDAGWLQMIMDEGHTFAAIMPLKGVINKHIFGSAGADDKTTEELIDHEQALCITIGPDGKLHTCDAGIDGSNHPPGIVSLLPEDPDAAAGQIREQIRNMTGKKVAVILADTEMLPFGTMDFAIGSAGIEPRARAFGEKDLFGKPKFGGIDLVANELTAASALLFGQAGAGIPAAVIRGCEYEPSETANISNTIWPRTNGSLKKAVKETIKATSYTLNWPKRLLLQIISWFV